MNSFLTGRNFTVCALLFSGVLANAFAWQNGPVLNETQVHTTTPIYLAADAANISTQQGYAGDIAVLLRLGGSAQQSFSGAPAASSNFDGSVWLKIDADTTAAKTGGWLVVLGGADVGTVSGDVNVWMTGHTYALGGTNFWGTGRAGSAVLGNLNLDIENSILNNLITVNAGTVAGSVNLNISGSTISTLLAVIQDAGSVVSGSVNVLLENSYVGTDLRLINTTNGNPTPLLYGDMNVKLYGTSINGQLRLGANWASTTGSLTIAGAVMGDINAVLGGYWDESAQTYVKGSTPTVIGTATGTESVLMTGGRAGDVGGNTNLVIVDGTYTGSITMGPNGGTLGTAGDAATGHTNLTIMDGTFNGNIFAGSHNYASTGKSGVVLGNANLTVFGGTFNGDIYVGVKPRAGLEILLYQNKIMGDAVATFTGNLSNITFNGTRVYAGEAEGDTVLRFAEASGNFGAEVSGFDIVSVDSDSAVAAGGNIQTQTLQFFADSVSTYGTLEMLGTATLSVGAIEVWLADGFSAQENDQLFLVEVSGTGVLQDTAVSLYNADGSAYAGLWRYDNDGSSLVITFLDIPENSLSAALLGLAAFLAVTRRRV